MRKTNKIGNINPMIYEKTRDGEVYYDVFSRLVKNRIVFLADSEGIDAETATSLVATLLFLDGQSKTKEISIYINSPGGTVSDGLFAIYDCIQFISAPIKTVVMGEACSAAGVLLVAGSQGKRFAMENASIMLHELQVSGMSGTGSEIQREAERVRRMNDKIIQIIANHSGQTFEKVKNDLKNDKWFTAEEALEYGLIDGIIKKTKTTPVKVSKVKQTKG